MRASGFPDWVWPDPPTDRMSDADLFEEWLIERWLRQIRSDEFKETAEYHYLRAEWERDG